MSSQYRLTINLGSNEKGEERYRKWEAAAIERGYRGSSAMVCDIVEWALDNTEWKPYEGPRKINGWTPKR